jgi:tRNA nucleotidyltransferase (CCA-adding enzyme)
MRDGDPMRIDLPPAVAGTLAALRSGNHEAALAGGCVRDLVRGEVPADWDVATSAPPEVVTARFPGATWENPFGTVTVRDPDDGRGIEVTTYRVEAGYRDRRRPDDVRWGSSLAEDLERRDFTINAMAWMPEELSTGEGRLIDPYAGAADLEAGLLRAVGDPDVRFGEDALRLLRAVRFASRFDLRLDPRTEAAIQAHAPEVAGLSGERVHDELMRILAGAAPPSAAFELMERLGLLQVVLPELAALRGIPQAKARAGDALDHSLRAADALPAADPVLRLAGLLHDVGKATTLADGHFLHHDREGAALAERIMLRLRAPRAEVARVTRLVRHHMFTYTRDWTDPAVRRFVRRVGADLLQDLFALRAADDVASGVDEPPSGWRELRERVAATAGDPLETRQLAVDGNDLVVALGIDPGPMVGRLLDGLLEAVLEDPSLNTREGLLELARAMASG